MTPKTDAAVAHGYRFTTDSGTREYVPADFARELERENAKLREAGNELARIVSAPPDSDYKMWPSDAEIDAAIAAWRKL